MEISGVGALPPSSPSFPVPQNSTPSFAVQQNPTPSFPLPQTNGTQAQQNTPPAQQAAKAPQPQETQHARRKPPQDPQAPGPQGPPQGLQASTTALNFAPGQVVDFHT